MATREKDAELRPGRKLLFWLALLAVPVGALLALEGCVRLFSGGGAPFDRYLTFTGHPDFFETVEVDGRDYYRVSHPQAYRARDIRFPVDKPAGTLRVFCLGESASAGWPHPPSEIWTAYLEEALQRAFPGRTFEVINVGAHAYPSYRVRFIFERVLDFDPDYIVLWTGNNEFLESRTYIHEWPMLGNFEALANHLAGFRFLRSWLIRLRYPQNALSGAEAPDPHANIWSKLARASLALREDPEQFERVKTHYGSTIDGMVGEAEKRGIPMLLVTVPVNLRDWLPNVSIDRLEGEQRARWQDLLAQGRRAALQAEPQRAVALLRGATELAPQHAETHYRLAQAVEQTGDYGAALAEYQLACDLDHNPFRAISAFNERVRAIAAAHGRAHLADLEGRFREAAAPRAPGFDVFLDYVHPNQRGGLIAARAVFDALLAAGLVDGAPLRDVPFVHTPAAFFPDGSPYDDDRDDQLQNTLFWLFGMMHQYEAMVRKAEHLQELGADLPAIRPVLRVFRDRLSLERRDLLGEPVGDEERARIEDRVDAYYKHTYKFEG